MTLEDRAETMAAAEFHALLSAAVDGICVIDECGCVLEFNEAAERLFGYSADQVKGRNVSQLMPEPDRSNHDGYIQHYLSTGERRIIGYGREVLGQRSNGAVFPMELSVGEVQRSSGQRRFVGIIRDLTAEKEAEQETRRLQDRLTHVGRFSVMGEMAAGLAHEINQPLSAISTYAQAGKRMMAGVDEVPEDLQDICDKIAEQAQRAGQVIKNLRSFISKQEVRKDVLDINRVVNDIRTLIEADARAEGIIISFKGEPKLPPVIGDAVQLQQVILNLTRNAVDAMKKGLRKEKGIAIQTGYSNGRVRLSVIDSGHGVSAQLAGSIFHPFVTTKGDGLGVGLAISRTIIQAHGGELSYRPNPQGGSIFGFSLPVHEEQSDD